MFISETWHHIDKHPEYIALLKKILRPGGQVVIIDFQKQETAVGPPMEMRVYERFDFIPLPSDPYHLFLLLKDVRALVASR